MQAENQDLEIVVKESGVIASKAQILVDSFKPLYFSALDLADKAKDITVTDITQVEEMAKAKEIGKALQRVRLDADEIRGNLKEESLREGKAIQSVFNVIKKFIEPIEESLKEKEKFAERAEQARLDAIQVERVQTLGKYVDDISIYNLREMTEDVFNNLVDINKKAYEDRQEVIRLAEVDRIAKENEVKAENERIRLENETLKAEKEAKAKADEEAKIIKDKADADAKAFIAKGIADEKARTDKIIADEREAKDKLQKEIDDKRIADEKAQKEIDDKIKADLQAKAKLDLEAKLAPDNDKLIAFANALDSVAIPEVTTDEANEKLKTALKILSQVLLTLRIK
jgi:hypothetical protein